MIIELTHEELNKCSEFAYKCAQNQQSIEFGQSDTIPRLTNEIGRDNLIGKIAEVAFAKMMILPPDIVRILAEYKKRINSRWMFPSPVKVDSPRQPSSVRETLERTLERAECKRLRFHDLRHTFATNALAGGMDIKTLSTIIGHISSETTLNIYTHITDNMQRSAADKIERGFGRNEGALDGDGKTPDRAPETPVRAKFEPKQPKIRRPGTGCIFRISEKNGKAAILRNCQTANAKSLISTPTQEKNAKKSLR